MLTIKKRGQKVCSNCKKPSGARAYVCKNCNAVFEIKNKHGIPVVRYNKTPIVSWRNLREGECIKVVMGSGPYRNTSNGKEYMGHSGKFVVMNICDNGINAYGISKHNHGHAFIYMGPLINSPIIPNLIRAPHKIVLCKRDK